MQDKFAILESYQALAKNLASRDSLAVLTSSRGGVACSVHPASVAVGEFVNPQSGAAALLGKEDLDFALPGALPAIWQRQYNSHVNPEHGSVCGLLGHGWHLPTEISLELRADRVLLFDATGRVITFYQVLEPGGQRHSLSEDLWLLRGGTSATGAQAYLPAWARQQRFARLSAQLAGDEHSMLVSNGTAGIWWVFTPAPVNPDSAGNTSHRSAGKDPNANTPGTDDHQHGHVHDNPTAHQPDLPVLGQRWRLTLQVDRFGRSQRYQYSRGDESGKRYVLDSGDDILPEGRLMALTDGMGRRYRLYHQHIHAGKPAQGPWGADDGWRLAGVELEHDPYAFTTQPISLVRYGYDRQGQLITVHDRSGELARQFEWHNARISGHCRRNGPWHRYRYEGHEPDVRVTEHVREQGLSYHFAYQSLPPTPDNKPAHATVVTDSLGRSETYCFEGQAGLSRLTQHHRADGSLMCYWYNSHGHLMSSMDPLQRKTSIRYDILGKPISMQQPGQLLSTRSYDQAERLTAIYEPTQGVIRCQYDDWGRCIQITRGNDDVEHYHYPAPQEQPLACERPIRIEDAKGAVRHLQYNDAGQLVSHTDSAGHVTLWSHDRWGDVIEKTDALGNTTRYERDAAGRITATHLPNGQIRRYQYDRQGNCTRIEFDENTPDSVLQINHDLWGRIIKTSLGGLTLKMNWDEAGRLITLTNENGVQSQFVWDAMNRLVQETGFDGRVQRYQWNAVGQLIASSQGSTAQQQNQTDQTPTIHYRWDETEHLIERQLPATQDGQRQSQRYEWDPAGRLKAASVYLIAQEQEQTQERLQSRIEIERDALGRITSEVQRLYKREDVPTPAPPIEYEHGLTHQFDASGRQQESQLQNVGVIQWLFDDSGRVHRLVHEGLGLIDFERNALHREIKRQWHTVQSAQSAENLAPEPLTQISHWDSLGRLQDTQLAALPPQAGNLVPPPLIDWITGRQYRYGTLGQIIALQTPAQTLHYGYDAAGRLRQRTDSLIPETTQRWEVDPAGNRLPGQTPTQQQQQNWAKIVHLRREDPAFNPLAGTPANQRDRIDRWPDNRIGFYQDCAWRYDAQGNRVEQIRQDANGSYSRQRLSYDGGNQLAVLYVESIDAQGGVTVLSESRYIYDALGRRLKNTISNSEREHVIYYGWEGDRLVHTERMKQDDTREIVHTIYELDSCTPLIRLSTTAKGVPQAKPHLMVQAVEAAVPVDQRSQLGLNHALTMMQGILAELPQAMQKKLEETMQQVFQSSPAAIPGINKVKRTSALIADMTRKMEDSIQETARKHNQELQGKIPSMARQSSDLIADMREGLQKMKQEEQGPVSIHYYLCNHFGIPLALIDQQGNIVWAVQLDPWGNIEEEFNPQNIDQPIRLAAQYHDRETGLYYNRDRYYDPKIHAYINQNPAGVNGKVNGYNYSFNPFAGVNSAGPWPLPLLHRDGINSMTQLGAMTNFARCINPAWPGPLDFGYCPLGGQYARRPQGSLHLGLPDLPNPGAPACAHSCEGVLKL